MARTSVDDFSRAVMRELETYQKNTIETVEAAVIQTAKETVAELKQTSPARTNGGDYAKSWSHKKDGNAANVWKYAHVIYSKAPYYRLTHLLEHGHARRGGGRDVPGKPHIAPAEQNAARRFEARLKRGLQE